MNLRDKNLKLLFALTALLTLFMPFFVPRWPLFFFAPFIVTTYYQTPRLQAVTLSFCIGLATDLILSEDRFGTHALAFALTSVLLYPEKRRFFADSLSTLPIMTYLFSAGSTVAHFILMQGLERDLALSAAWIFSDLIVMPLCDALFAFCSFTLPYFLFGKRQRKGSDYFVAD